MKRVALHNLGCKVNAYELDAMGQMLQEKGFKIVSFDEEADIYIVNTCTVTNIADRKSRQMLHRARKTNPEAVVVAVGCYVQTGQEAVEKDPCIDLAIGNNRKKDLITILESFLEERGASDKTLHGSTVIDIGSASEYEDLQLEKTGGHRRAYIKIQDGCDQFCSYCIIPYARGRVRSRRAEEVLTEVVKLTENGYQEIVFTGIHISSYGVDFERAQAGDHRSAREAALQKQHLLNLIRRVHGIEGVKRIRLGSLEPRIITEEFAEQLSELPKLCPHFHLSLQSGCDATLRRMNRQYSSGEYYEKVLLLRKYFAAPAITTDVITGFPQESEEEFAETKEFLEKVGFYEIHIFKYSKRQGTAAASMQGQITEKVKTERSAELMEMERKHSREYRRQFLGQACQVLFETTVRIDGKDYLLGHTRRYIKAAVPMTEFLITEGLTVEELSGRICACLMQGFLTDDILLAKTIR